MAVQFLTSAQVNSILELYVAYFNRAPEAKGLSDWSTYYINQLNAGKTDAAITTDIANQFYDAAVVFSASSGYTATMTVSEFITKAYANVLSRSSVDAAGMTYWTAQLTSGAMSKGQFIKQLIADAKAYIAANPTDPVSISVGNSLSARLQVATEFSKTSISGALTGDAAVTAGINALAGVVDSATAAARITAIDNATYNAGSSYLLTTGATSVNEGATATFNLATSGVANGTVVNYTLSGTGVTAGDVTGGLTGSVTVVDNKAVISVPVAADRVTEGTETLKITINGTTASATVTVADTSTNTAPTFAAPTAAVSVVENTTAVAGTGTASDIDASAGDVVTYTLTGADAALFNVSSTGAISFKTAPNFEAPGSAAGTNVYSVNLVATDKGGLSVTQAETITVTNANEAPTFAVATAAVSVAENTTAVSGTGAATDVDAGDTQTYSLTGADAALFNVSATGSLSFKAAPNFEAPGSAAGTNVYSVNLVATDKGGMTATQAETITVTNANEAPTFAAATAAVSVAENSTAVTGTGTASDVDAGDTQTYTLTGADAALFSVSTAGAISFKAAPNFEAPGSAAGTNVYSVNLVATDKGGMTATQAETITVTNVNDVSPVITSAATASAAENQTAVTTVVATDGDAGTVVPRVYSIVGGSDADKFNIDAATGVVTFVQAPNFEAPTDTGADNVYNIIVQASDGVTTPAQQSIAITVTNVNDVAPVITSAAAASVAENQTAAITVTATDGDAGTVVPRVYSISGGADAALFNIDSATGVVTFKAAPNFEAAADAGADNVYNITVQASDGVTTPATQAVAITVTNVNDVSPVITSAATASVAENQTAAITVAATDGDGGTVVPRVYSITGGADAALFNIDSATGVVTFKTAPNAEAAADAGADNVYNITVQATDGVTTPATQNIAITVTNVNDVAPVITSAATASVAENGTAAYTVVATDGDVGTVVPRVYSISGGADAALFNIDAATGAVTFKAAPNFEAPTDAGADNVYNIIVQASDGVNTAATQAVAITVTNVNDVAPVITSAATASVAENQTAAITVVATDGDAGTVVPRVYSISGGADAALFNIDSATGVVTFKTAPNAEAAADAGADNVYNITVQASDGVTTPATQAVAITVTNVNDVSPVITSSAAVSVAENQTAAVTVVATDGDIGTVVPRVYSITGGADAALFNIDSATGVVTFKAAPNFEAPADVGADNVYNITVQATDGVTTPATQNVAITVTNVNDVAPVITSGNTFSVAENQTSAFTVVATDGDGGTVVPRVYSISGGTDAALFNIDSATGVVTFKAAPDFELVNPTHAGGNTYAITVSASDGVNTPATQAVTINVTNVDDNTLSAVSDSNAAVNAVPENSPVGTVVGLTALATDADTGSAVTYALSAADVAADKFRINATTGVVTTGATALDYEAAGGTGISTTITVTATNATGVSTSQAFVISTLNVNEKPVVTAGQVFNVTENTTTLSNNAVGGTNYVAATDPDGDFPHNWTIVSGNADGNFAIDAFSGLISVVAGKSFDYESANKTYSIGVTATDGAPLTSDVATITINVKDANDVAPVVSSGATATVAENTAAATVLYQATSTDVDTTGEVATYTLGGADAALFTLTAAGALTFKASPNYEAPADVGADNVYDVTVTPTDGKNVGAAKAVQITVTDVNDVAPVFSPAVATPFSIAENTTAVGTAVATDGDGTAANRNITYSLTGADAAKFAVSAAGVVTVAAGAGLNFEANGSAASNNAYAFNVVASDGANSTTQAVVVNVTDVNEAPTANALTITALSGQSTTVYLNDTTKTNTAPNYANAFMTTTDVDTSAGFGVASHLITSVTQPTSGGTVALAADGKSLVVASALGLTTPFSFTYTIKDVNGTGLSSTNTITVNPNTNLGGTPGDDTLVGGTAAENLDGIGGNDLIIGGGGLDTISGGDGNDTVYFNDAAAQINGGAGIDTLVVNADAVAQAFDLSQSSQQNIDTLSKNSQGNRVTVRAFENLDATKSVNAIMLNATNDTARAGGTGGDSTDTTSIIGSSSSDSLYFTRATGTVSVYGNAGNDAIDVDNNANGGGTFAGAGAATGKFYIDGGDGNDTIRLQDTSAAHTVLGGAGNDTITLGSGASTVSGGDGNDVITNTSNGANVTIDGGAGNDSITGGTGVETLLGGAGDDTIVSGGGNDSIDGGDGNDSITGGASGGLTNGGTISGGAGDDTIVGTAGNDNLSGGDGNDVFQVTAANLQTTSSGDTISGGNNTDTLDITAIANGGTVTLGTASVPNITSIETVAVTGTASSYTLAMVDQVGVTSLLINEDTTTDAKDVTVTGLTVGASVSLIGAAAAATRTMGTISLALTTNTTADALTVKLVGSSTPAGTAEQQTFTVNTAATASGNITVGGVNVAVANGDTAAQVATKIAAAAATIKATVTTIDTITANGTTVTITYLKNAGNVGAIATGAANGVTFGGTTDNAVAFVAAADNTVTTLTANQIETLSIESNASGAALVTSTGNQNIVGTLNATAATTLNLSGASALTLSTAATAPTINAGSMTGELNLTLSGVANVTLTGSATAKNTFALGTTLNNSDNITGGAATNDVLSATVTSATATTGALKISNVETLNLTEAGTSTVDTTNISGATAINFAGASTALTVTNLPASGTSLGLGFAGTATNHSAGTVTPSLKDATGTNDSLTINLQSTAGNTATLVTTNIENLNLVVAAETNGTNTLTNTNMTASKVTITGSTNGNDDVLALGTLNAATTNVTATGYTGPLTVTASASNTTIAMAGTNAANNVTGGAGNDTVTYTTFGGVAESVAGGAGTNDTLTISSLTAALDATNIATFENINVTLAANQTPGNYTGLVTSDVLTQTWSGAFTLTMSTGFHTNMTSFNASGVSGAVAITNTTADTGADSTVTWVGGSATTDSLTVSYAAAATYAPKISAFETVKIFADSNNSGGETHGFNLANVTGASTGIAFATSTAGNTVVNVTNYDGSTTLQLGHAVGTGKFMGASTLDVQLASNAGTADAVNLRLTDTNNAAATITVTGTGIETVNINAGANNSTQDHKLDLSGIAVTAGSSQTINITGGMSDVADGTALTITNTNASANTIAASGFIGSLTMTGRGSSSAMTITTGTGADTVIMKNVADVLDAGTQATGQAATKGDTLVLQYAGIAGAIVDLSNGTDQVTLMNGLSNAAVQKGFENLDASLYTGGAVDVTAATTGSFIKGSAAADVMRLGAGADVAKLLTPAGNGVDTITGFAVASDKIALLEGGSGWNAAGTAGTAAGTTMVTGDYNTARASVATITAAESLMVIELSGGQTTAQLSTGTAAGAANAYVLAFNTTTGVGELWYDADWTDATGRTQVATFSDITTLVGVTNFTFANFQEYI